MSKYISNEQLELLNFYRSEIKHEFNMLSTRLNLLITCQSFLVVPFAILQNASNFLMVCIPSFLVIFLGAYTSWIVKRPLAITQNILGEWMVKQRLLLAQLNTDEYKIQRDCLSGVHISTDNDSEHRQSIAFSRKSPNAFLFFWFCSFILSACRLINTLDINIHISKFL
jgi:hypothetical protein